MYSALACMFQAFTVARSNEMSKALFIWAVGISVSSSSSKFSDGTEKYYGGVSKLFKINHKL